MIIDVMRVMAMTRSKRADLSRILSCFPLAIVGKMSDRSCQVFWVQSVKNPPPIRDCVDVDPIEFYNVRFPWNKLNHQYDELLPLKVPVQKRDAKPN